MDKITLQFLSKLKEASTSKQEKSVEDAYTNALSAAMPKATHDFPFKCDGYFIDHSSENEVRLLTEFKYNKNLRTVTERSKAIFQAIFYMKKFETAGMQLPNVVVIGDIDEVFVLNAAPLIKYLDREINWSAAPSNAYADKGNASAFMDLCNDTEINPFIQDIDDTFCIAGLVAAIHNNLDTTKRLVKLSMANFETLFKEFHSCIRGYYNRLGALVKEADIKDKEEKDEYAHDLVAAFLGCISCNPVYGTLSSDPKRLGTPTRQFEVVPSKLEDFNSKYSTEDMDTKSFDAVSDRLIDEVTRSGNGQYYTPTDYVNFAHEEISRQFGADWKEKFVVWDESAGTCNLTRDYTFKELYTSTLEHAEVEIGSKYNPEATHFQFDFLNDYIPGTDRTPSKKPAGSRKSAVAQAMALFNGGGKATATDMDDFFGDTPEKPCKLPEGLLKALKEDKPIMFFMNPPYVGAGKGAGSGATGTLIRETGSITKEHMKAAGLGQATNMYSQFLYRIIEIKQAYNLTNVAICVFCPSIWLTSTRTFVDFRTEFSSHFGYCSGHSFSAEHFGLAANWQVLFSVWSSQSDNKITVNYPISILDTADSVVTKVGEHILKSPVLGSRLIDTAKCTQPRDTEAPNMSSGIIISQNSELQPQNTLGFAYMDSNIVAMNSQSTSLFSSVGSTGHGFPITSSNLISTCVTFSARRLINCSWFTHDDEYAAPLSQNTEFENDSLIFSLFESKSSQSSLCNVNYHDKTWRIRNNFFFMSTEEMQALGADTLGESDPYMYTLLQSKTLSPEALDVLNAARNLVRLSWSSRKAWGSKPGCVPGSKNEYMDYQIENWDCGYYQLKNLWKEMFPVEFKAFKEKFHTLARKMKPMVYELGMLPKPTIYPEYADKYKF